MPHQQLCRNCGLPTEGLYCANCGQRNNVERLKWATLADGFVSSFVGDGAIGEKRSNVRYGFLLTIWSIVFRPRQTIGEYLEGRRRKYFNPVTILLLLSGFYALVSVFFGIVDDAPKTSDIAFIEYLRGVIAYCSSHPATWYLLLLPFTALAYKWIFRNISDLRYIEYMYVGIFVAIFSVALLFMRMPFELWPAAKPIQDDLLWASFAALCWYSVVIFRGLFRVGYKRAVWSWVKVTILSYTLCFLTMLLVSASALWGYYKFAPESFKETFYHLFSEDEAEEPQEIPDAIDAADSLKSNSNL